MRFSGMENDRNEYKVLALYLFCTHSVLLLDQIDDVGGIVGEHGRRGALDVALQLLVDGELIGGDREDNVDGVLLDLLVDLRNTGVVLQHRVGVHALGVEMALAVVGGDHSTELAVAGVVEAGVRGEDQEATGLLAPADLLPAGDGLHDGVEATLGCVQVAGYGGILYLVLPERDSVRMWSLKWGFRINSMLQSARG